MSRIRDVTSEQITANSLEDVKPLLRNFGVCVVPQVLSPSECSSLFNETIWDFERMTSSLKEPFRFRNPKTWETLQLFKPYQNQLYKHWGLGQSQYIWDLVRTNPKVIEVFATIWNTRELICSFDGISLHLPGEVCEESFFHKNHWYHMDQSLLKPHFDCVQGWVNAFDTREGDATLVCIPGSHHHFGEYAEMVIEEFDKKNGYDEKKRIKEFSTDWVKPKDLSFFEKKGLTELHVTCPRGSLVLWDSRLLHYGSQPIPSRERPNIRCVSYVCMVPAARISTQYTYSEKVFAKRSMEYVQGRRTTNHWPQHRKLVPHLPSSRFERVDDPGFTHPNPPKLTPVGYQLVTGDYD